MNPEPKNVYGQGDRSYASIHKFAVHKNILSCRLNRLNSSAFFMTGEKFVFLARKVFACDSLRFGLMKAVRESQWIG
jgi:hypothetical protein